MIGEVIPFRLVSGAGVDVLDQTLLPAIERYVRIETVEVMVEAIRALRVRGAPLLGIMGAAGMAIAATRDPSDAGISAGAEALITSRPTAVDLGTRVNQSLALLRGARETGRAGAAWEFAADVARERVAEDRAMGAHGAPLLSGGVLTHCNTGSLATGGIGSALGAIRTAWEQGRITMVYATETRPLLQGARLTMWELTRLGIPATLLPDTAAAALIASGAVSAVITGADRIAANGDSANKIGTYGLALAAARHSVPFYIAAPLSTLDLVCPDGGAIPIEYRAAEEVGGFDGWRWTVAAAAAFNPAFDVTPADLIAGIITEAGIARTPFERELAALSPTNPATLT